MVRRLSYPRRSPSQPPIPIDLEKLGYWDVAGHGKRFVVAKHKFWARHGSPIPNHAESIPNRIGSASRGASWKASTDADRPDRGDFTIVDGAKNAPSEAICLSSSPTTRPAASAPQNADFQEVSLQSMGWLCSVGDALSNWPTGQYT